MILITAFWTFFLAEITLCFAVTTARHGDNFHPDYVLRVSEENRSIACRTKPTALVNGTSPGPALYLTENQTTWVRVYNDYEDANLTIHWHGLSQSVSPFSDGTPRASQWPIKAHHFFDYELRPQQGEAGTYFYHSHVDFQAVSVAGPLIVQEEDSNPPYSYDEERIAFFSEVYNKTDQQVPQGLTKPDAEFSWTGEAASILVNGKGYRSLDANQTGTSQPWGPGRSDNGTCGPGIISVSPGKTYRLRAIAGVAMSPFVFAIENHQDLGIMAADGSYTKLLNTSYVPMGAGQRYDILFRAKTEAELKKIGQTKFWVQIETRYRAENNTFYALLDYGESTTLQSSPVATKPPNKKPVHIPYHTQGWGDYTLEPLTPNDFPDASKVSRQVFLSSAQIVNRNGVYWTASNRTWTEDNKHEISGIIQKGDTPYLPLIYQKGEAAIPDYQDAVDKHGGYDPEFNAYPAKVGEVIDIILVNEPNGLVGGFDTHPWHIHGGRVYDLGSGPGVYNATENEKKLHGYDPIMRDTSFLFKYVNDDDVGQGLNYTSQDWRAWRLKVNDPGVWMVHCHILQHMIMGMQTVWIMGNASEITRNTTPDLVSGYLTYGGNAYGNISSDPFVAHFYDD